ncbi:3-dehydroquinate synthase [Parvularcula oceani]|uniref:3-dehydroquinate synthase n=1 Tax=Parvularcula oceani TaxID=1247963 RepID=UPI0009E0933D|nr:3-dehydroquinate synthase [Parvularcula oceani]
METVEVALGERAYPILIGAGALSAAASRIAGVIGAGRAAIVADEAVLRHHMQALKSVLPDIPIIPVPSGEAAKSFPQYERVCESLLRAGVGRDGTVIAFGGGVAGDLAGFCAATLRRGCRFVQVPTTLLAQVDSSVGGKTAINARAGKNLIGAFHQPSLVVIDTDLLRTLPEREIRAGYAEILKYALLGDRDFADWLEKNAEAVLRLEADAVGHAVAISCRTKAAIVAADEREAGRRALLNLGHTFGHAIEAAGRYDGRVLHGEGVAVGMAMAFRYAAAQGTCPQADAERAQDLIGRSGLPVRLSDLPPLGATPDGLLDAMYQDKKVEGGALTLILPRALGDAYVVKGVDGESVRAFLENEIGFSS